MSREKAKNSTETFPFLKHINNVANAWPSTTYIIKPIPPMPMPPMSGIAGAFGSGLSATTASVVKT